MNRETTMNYNELQNLDTTVMISQMMALLNDTDIKIFDMENQPWYKKMVFTVFGKNKATKEEIRVNHEKLNSYLVNTIIELYRQSAYEKQAIVSLGMQLNQIFASHNELKLNLVTLVDKLNEKVESVRDFNILQTEIDQGVYSEKFNHIAGLLYVAVQIDERMLSADNQMGIIRRSLCNRDVINDEERNIIDYLNDLSVCENGQINVIYPGMLLLHNNSLLAKIFAETIERYNLQCGDFKTKIDKEKLFKEILESNNINVNAVYTTRIIFDSIIDAKKILLNNINQDTRGLMPERTGKERINSIKQGIKGRAQSIRDNAQSIPKRESRIKEKTI